MADGSAVRLVPGTGLVARRHQELLFTPHGSSDLVDEFDRAAPGEAIEHITGLAAESGFSLSDFVVLEWSGQVRIALFGDIEVTSDHRSLPRLSGTGAGTWVERAIPNSGARLSIGVATENANEYTDLRAGVVEAGGFEVLLQPEVETATSADGDHDDSGERPRPQDIDDPSTSRPKPTDGPSPTELASALWGPAPASSIDQEEPRQESPGTKVSTSVESGASIDEAEIVVDRPASWRIRFSDGRAELVDRTLLLGRSPSARPQDDIGMVRLVALDCSRVSSTHLEVCDADGELRLTDLGSRNGSFMLATGDGQPVRLEDGLAVSVGHGAHVQIGSQLFVVEDLSRA